MKESPKIALHIVIVGLVQGVGFRPFITRQALKLGLAGYVKNIGGSEVEVWIEGPVEEIYEYLISLYFDKPPNAQLEQIYVSFENPLDYTSFVIEKSDANPYARSNIPPDFAMCRDCLMEILDPNDRRYRYPFNSCAWCGPRFSMIRTVPYDRENTAMYKYNLCSECLSEYRDPDNIRRYHAQGISCPRDGPSLQLVDRDFKPIDNGDPISETAKLIDEGFIVAIKGIGGYHIASLASNDDVVLELRRRKKRPRKPFAVMGLDTSVLKKLVYMDERDEELLNSPQAPILLLPKKPGSPVSKYVSPDLNHEGVFVAYTPLHYLLLMNTRDRFLIMTSGNVSGEPMCVDEECVKEKLSRVVDYVLIHDREIVNRVDDSVIRKTGDNYLLLRRSRGYTPAWIELPLDLNGEYIAFGGDLNNNGAIGFENKIVLTQYIGDMESLNAQRDLLKYMEFLVKNYRLGEREKPIVVVDMHPRYNTRVLGLKYAEKYSFTWIDVQHHYAHVLGTAIDNELRGVIAGVAMDGIGWGLDNTIWGGEILVFNTEKYGFRRVASLAPLPLTSDRDTYIPLRIVYNYLALRGYNFEEISKLVGVNDNNSVEYQLTYKLVKQGKYIPASSTGRLVDLAAAILKPDIMRTYEGEPAIWLESIAYSGDILGIDDYGYVDDNGVYRLDYSGIIDWLIEKRSDVDKSTLAKSFLYAIGYSMGDMLVETTRGYGIDHVVVSGGAAVNEFIFQGLRERLRSENLPLYLPRRIPSGDGGLSFGQIIAASLRSKNDLP